MKRAVIVCNGDLANINNVAFLKSDFIVCADGAVEKLLKKNMLPAIVIGDFDSTQEKTIQKLKEKNIQLIEYPREKDKTDSELALDYVVQKKYRKIIICGLLGSRIDHLLSNILMLSTYIHKGCDITVVENKTTVYTVREKISIQGMKNDIVSIVPITNEASGIETIGLHYALTNESLIFGSTRGISNYMIKNSAEITLKKGILLAIHIST